MSGGWDASAAAWIATMEGDAGDFGRRFVLDAPMLARVDAAAPGNALDVGCGEGRFCRMLSARGISATGIDPTAALIAEAQRRDPGGTYHVAAAEHLPFGDAAFDLVISYLSLIDIADIAAAIGEMARVLRPGGRLLIANLTSFNTAGQPEGWRRDLLGREHFRIDNYMEERAEWAAWRGIRIQNWHRPLERYMALLLGAGLELRHFAEPMPQGGDPARAARFRRVPWFMIMDWQKRG